MKGRSNITILIFIAIVLAVGYFLVKGRGPKYDWNSTYSKTSSQPYGTDLFYKYLDKAYKVKPMYPYLLSELDSNKTGTTLFYCFTSFDSDSSDCLKLMDYVAAGNNLVIATDDAPLELMRNFVPINDTIKGYRFKRDSITTMFFDKEQAPLSEKINLVYRKYNDTIGYSWGFYPKTYFEDTLSSYGFNAYAYFGDSSVTAFSVKHGKGQIFIHANPILFTNFYLARNEGYAHTNNMLKYFNKGNVYWYEYKYDPAAYDPSDKHSNNPLRFLFSTKSLKTGWYLFLVAILLYVVFRSKREQRVIPILPKVKNTAVEFIKTSALLYYKANGHQHIAKEMHTVFLAELRNQYNLVTDIAEPDLIHNLSVKSGVDVQVVSKLFSQFKYVMTPNIATNDDLIELHALIENYNKIKK